MRQDKVMAEKENTSVVWAIHQVCTRTHSEESHKHSMIRTNKSFSRHSSPSESLSASPVHLSPQGHVVIHYWGCDIRKDLLLTSYYISKLQWPGWHWPTSSTGLKQNNLFSEIGGIGKKDLRRGNGEGDRKVKEENH